MLSLRDFFIAKLKVSDRARERKFFPITALKSGCLRRVGDHDWRYPVSPTGRSGNLILQYLRKNQFFGCRLRLVAWFGEECGCEVGYSEDGGGRRILGG